jgi:hypothetical protein
MMKIQMNIHDVTRRSLLCGGIGALTAGALQPIVVTFDANAASGPSAIWTSQLHADLGPERRPRTSASVGTTSAKPISGQ